MANGAAPRRRSDAGGYPRGEETRGRIVAAALKVFGAEGFERGSTRRIAALAAVPPPALQYYFDSKEGLHRACADFIIESFSRAMAGPLAAAEAALDAGGAERALEALCDLLDAIAEYCLATPDDAVRSRFIGRGQADDAGPAFPLIRDRISVPLHQVCSRLVGAVNGADPTAEATRLEAVAILSPLTAFHVNRTNTLAVMGWSGFAGGRLDAIKQILRAHTRAALGAPRAAAQSASATPPSTGIVAPTT